MAECFLSPLSTPNQHKLLDQSQRHNHCLSIGYYEWPCQPLITIVVALMEGLCHSGNEGSGRCSR